MHVAIIGLGLIGGSAALDLKRAGFADTITGVGNRAETMAEAERLGLVDRFAPLEEAVDQADLVIVAVPVDVAIRILPKVLDRITERQAVTDMCSTKRTLMSSVEGHPRRDRFVGSHPMAGTEYAGPQAALEGLFRGKVGILCDTEKSALDAVARVEAMYACLGMNLVRMDAARHDLHTAYVSHLSHVVSYALALTVLDKERDESQIFNLAGGGFASTARLAKSGAAMWTPIFLHNADHVLEALDAYREHLTSLRDAIARSDVRELNRLIGKANDIRRILG